MKATGLALAGLLLALAGCAQPGAAPAPRHAAPTPPALVRIAWPDVGPPTPFRVSSSGPGGAALLSLIYDTLTWKDERGIIPWLATGWSISGDGRDYSFTLRQPVAWQDGRPLTAQDVAFSFDYYSKHPYKWMPTAMVSGAEATDGEHVVIHLKEPYAAFLEDVAGAVPVIPEHVWANVTDPGAYGGPDASLGSGPYRLAEYRSAEGAYRLVANPRYFAGAVKIGEVQQVPVSDEAKLPSIRRGELDVALAADASAFSAADGSGSVAVFQTPPLSVVRLAVNTERPPLDRAEVRRAIAYALDRARIAELMTKAPAVIDGMGAIPPGSPWFNPGLQPPAFDPGRARELLGGQTYTLELLADPSSREPELMQPMLQAVGINLVVKRVDAKTRTELLREKKFQLGLVSHIGVGGDPDFLRRWYAGEESNDFAQGSVFHNAELDRLGREEASALDAARRHEAVDRMQEVVAAELPTIVLYFRRFYWFYNPARFTPVNTWGGLMNGMPLPYNKLAFLQRPGG